MALNPIARAAGSLGLTGIRRSAAAPAATAKPKAEEGGEQQPEEQSPEEDARARREGESDAEYDERMRALDEAAERHRCEEEDEQDREEMRGNTAVAQARARERARCLAIFGHPAAAANPALARRLAESSMGRHEACAILAEAPVAGGAKPKGELSRAMEGFAQHRPGPGAVAPASGQAALTASWDAAAQRAGVRRPATR